MTAVDRRNVSVLAFSTRLLAFSTLFEDDGSLKNMQIILIREIRVAVDTGAARIDEELGFVVHLSKSFNQGPAGGVAAVSGLHEPMAAGVGAGR